MLAVPLLDQQCPLCDLPIPLEQPRLEEIQQFSAIVVKVPISRALYHRQCLLESCRSISFVLPITLQ